MRMIWLHYIIDDIMHTVKYTLYCIQLTSLKSSGVAIEKVEEHEPLKGVHWVNWIPQQARHGTPYLQTRTNVTYELIINHYCNWLVGMYIRVFTSNLKQ